MCFPMVFAALGTAVSMAGTLMGASAQQSQANAQAKAYERQATLEATSGAYQAQRKQEQVNQVTGQQIAGTASSGVQLDGSPTDVIGSTASEGALDVGAIRWGAKNKADTFMYDASLSRLQGKNAMAAGYVGAAGDLFGGLGKIGTYLGRNPYMAGGQGYGYGSGN